MYLEAIVAVDLSVGQDNFANGMQGNYFRQKVSRYFEDIGSKIPGEVLEESTLLMKISIFIKTFAPCIIPAFGLISEVKMQEIYQFDSDAYGNCDRREFSYRRIPEQANARLLLTLLSGIRSHLLSGDFSLAGARWFMFANRDAWFISVVIVVNSMIGIIQGAKAKRVLRQLS